MICQKRLYQAINNLTIRLKQHVIKKGWLGSYRINGIIISQDLESATNEYPLTMNRGAAIVHLVCMWRLLADNLASNWLWDIIQASLTVFL